MRSIRNAIHNPYAASHSMGVRLLLYWFTMALLLVAAILSILMAMGVLSHLRGSWPAPWTFSREIHMQHWMRRWMS